MINLNKIDLNAKYETAGIAFKECMEANPEAEAEEEIGLTIDTIVPKGEWVRITFYENSKDKYLVETRLTLLSRNGEEVGWYCFHEDENGKVVDDYLVFE